MTLNQEEFSRLEIIWCGGSEKFKGDNSSTLSPISRVIFHPRISKNLNWDQRMMPRKATDRHQGIDMTYLTCRLWFKSTYASCNDYQLCLFVFAFYQQFSTLPLTNAHGIAPGWVGRIGFSGLDSSLQLLFICLTAGKSGVIPIFGKKLSSNSQEIADV